MTAKTEKSVRPEERRKARLEGFPERCPPAGRKKSPFVKPFETPLTRLLRANGPYFRNNSAARGAK